MLRSASGARNVALARYRDALRAELPAAVAEVVRRQADGAKRNHDRIRGLRDQLKAIAA